MKLLLFVVIVFSQPVGLRSPECVCVKDPHPSEEKVKTDRRQAYDRSAAIFAGKVVALDAYAVEFRLEKRWKGGSHDEIVLSTGASRFPNGMPLSAECSYHFRLGEGYLVYAYTEGGKLRADICSTLPVKDATEEEKGLDEIVPHETIKEKSNE
jgi:hypothetical protein